MKYSDNKIILKGRSRLCPWCNDFHRLFYNHIRLHNKSPDDYGLELYDLKELPKCHCGKVLHFDTNKCKFPSTCSISCARSKAVNVSISKGSSKLIHINRVDPNETLPLVGNNENINNIILNNSFKILECGRLKQNLDEILSEYKDQPWYLELIANVLFSVSETGKKIKFNYSSRFSINELDIIQHELDKLSYKSQNNPRICYICMNAVCSKFPTHIKYHGISVKDYLVNYRNIVDTNCLICGRELPLDPYYGKLKICCSKYCEIKRRHKFGNSIGNTYSVILSDRALRLKSTAELVIFLWLIFIKGVNPSDIVYEKEIRTPNGIRYSDFIVDSNHYEVHSKYDIESKIDAANALKLIGIETIFIYTEDIQSYKLELYNKFNIFKYIKSKMYESNVITLNEINRLTIDYSK